MTRPAKIVSTGKLSRKQTTDLIQIGQRMSNMCFNLKQSDKFEPNLRQSFRELQEEWDAIKRGEN